jgi:hypothetical protein
VEHTNGYIGPDELSAMRRNPRAYAAETSSLSARAIK